MVAFVHMLSRNLMFPTALESQEKKNPSLADRCAIVPKNVINYN